VLDNDRPRDSLDWDETVFRMTTVRTLVWFSLPQLERRAFSMSNLRIQGHSVHARIPVPQSAVSLSCTNRSNSADSMNQLQDFLARWAKTS
jgi:hypothetical protein